jgi:hypothetical protein
VSIIAHQSLCAVPASSDDLGIGCFSISIRGQPLVVQIAARSLKRINSTAILAAARIPVQMEFSLGTGICLYPNVWEHVRNITNLRDHPYEFYQMLGFVIVGMTLLLQTPADYECGRFVFAERNEP